MAGFGDFLLGFVGGGAQAAARGIEDDYYRKREEARQAKLDAERMQAEKARAAAEASRSGFWDSRLLGAPPQTDPVDIKAPVMGMNGGMSMALSSRITPPDNFKEVGAGSGYYQDQRLTPEYMEVTRSVAAQQQRQREAAEKAQQEAADQAKYMRLLSSPRAQAILRRSGLDPEVVAGDRALMQQVVAQMTAKDPSGPGPSTPEWERNLTVNDRLVSAAESYLYAANADMEQAFQMMLKAGVPEDRARTAISSAARQLQQMRARGPEYGMDPIFSGSFAGRASGPDDKMPTGFSKWDTSGRVGSKVNQLIDGGY